MTDEQRLQMITNQLILVRDNLFRGMSKSIQKLQARSINEVLELENFTQSPQRTWVDLSDEEIQAIAKQARSKDHAVTLTNKFLRDKNT
jgi:hypothetical protein